jgi:hypothetical protein
MEQQAREALTRLRLEYEQAAKPYVKILCDIASIRPRVYIVDGQTIVPFDPPKTSP